MRIRDLFYKRIYIHVVTRIKLETVGYICRKTKKNLTRKDV